MTTMTRAYKKPRAVGKKPATAMATIQATANAISSDDSFIVTSKGHRFRFTPEEVGYSVSEVGGRGVNTQGDTFEEALSMAHDASRAMAEFREEMQAESMAKAKEIPAAKRRSAALATAKRQR